MRGKIQTGQNDEFHNTNLAIVSSDIDFSSNDTFGFHHYLYKIMEEKTRRKENWR